MSLERVSKMNQPTESASHLFAEAMVGADAKGTVGARGDTAKLWRDSPVRSPSDLPNAQIGSDGSINFSAPSDNIQRNLARHIEDPQDREVFTRHMQAFERRAQRDGISQEEIERTYQHLNRMLESPQSMASQADRVLAARSMMMHLAYPTDTDQGVHDTCGVAVTEERLLTRNPAIAAEMLSSTMTRGMWEAPDGRMIKIHRDNLVPGAEERNFPPRDGERTYASQVLQVMLMNDITQRRDPPQFFRQERPTNRNDHGERLYEEDGSKSRSPLGVLAYEIGQQIQRMTGEGQTVLWNHNEARQHRDTTRGVYNAAELREALVTAQGAGRLPLVIMVDANHPNIGGQGRGVGAHFVSIVGFNAETGMVQISNQYGRRQDRSMSVEDLYDAMLYRGNITPEQQRERRQRRAS